jgi:hypothetical protein
MRHLSEGVVLERAIARLDKLTPGTAAKWGRMSAHQMVCHLSDSFRFALGKKAASDASGVLQRTAMKWFALYVPIPWPKGVGTRPEMEQGKGGTAPIEFEADRRDLIALMREFERQPWFTVRHPIFGPMSTAEWMRWGYLHVDHHLRQFGV